MSLCSQSSTSQLPRRFIRQRPPCPTVTSTSTRNSKCLCRSSPRIRAASSSSRPSSASRSVISSRKWPSSPRISLTSNMKK